MMNLIKCFFFLCLFYLTNAHSQVTVSVSNLKSNGVSVTNNTLSFNGAKDVTLDLNVNLTTFDGNSNNTLGNLFLYFKPKSTDIPIQVGFTSVTFITNHPPFVSQTTYTSSISFSSIKLISSNFFANGGVFYAEYRNNNNKAFQSSNILIRGGTKVLPERFVPPNENNTICCNQTIRLGDKPAIINGTKLSKIKFELSSGGTTNNVIEWLNGDNTKILNNVSINSDNSFESDYLLETTVIKRENRYLGFKPSISNSITITVVPSPIISNTINAMAPLMPDGSYDVVENVEFSSSVSKVNLNVLNNPFHIVQRNDTYKDVVDYQWQFKLDGNNEKWSDIPDGKVGLINYFSLKMVSNKFVNFYYVRRIAKYQNISKVSNVLKILNRKTSVTNTICCSQKLEIKSSGFSLPSVLVGSTPVFSIIDAVGFDSPNNPPINIKLLSYQWQKSDISRGFASWENIDGANSKDYLPEKITSGGTSINYRRVVKYKYQNIGYYTSDNKPVYVDKFYETYSNIANLYTSQMRSRKYADVELDENFKIYPNPVNSILNILGSSSTDSYKIFNSAGQEMELNTIISDDNSISFDVSNLSNGVYYISTVKDNEVIVKKFVKY